VPSLTFVVIAHNEAARITKLLDTVLTAVDRANWSDAQILVVDDGSTDNTVEVVADLAVRSAVPIKVLSQPNLGRLAATRAGVQQATGEYICILGTRMRMHPDSLCHLQQQLTEHPERRVWNCHIDTPTAGNLQAQFWCAMTFVGWRRYLADPRLVSFGTDEFDYYPTGTGGFVAPKELLIAGYEQLDSIYDDDEAQYASDDTALLRYIAQQELIWMTPEYSADYLARTGFVDFVKHTYHRGTMFLDSYLRPGTRLYWPTIVVLAASVPAAVLAVRKPKVLLGVPVAVGGATAGLAVLGVEKRNLPGFALLAPVFGVVFTAGMWKGLWLLIRARLRRP
jgi:glycosyltransferase involved in cell wall biosynthesis